MSGTGILVQSYLYPLLGSRSRQQHFIDVITFLFVPSAGSVGNSLALWPVRAPTRKRATPFSITSRRAFFLFPFFFVRRTFFVHFLFSWAPCLLYALACVPSSIHLKHNTAQRDQACTKEQSNRVPARARLPKRADRQPEQANMVG